MCSNSVSVLINSCPTSDFQAEQGLRQDDTLSLFLFILETEGIIGLLKNETSYFGYKPFKMLGNLVFDIF